VIKCRSSGECSSTESRYVVSKCARLVDTDVLTIPPMDPAGEYGQLSGSCPAGDVNLVWTKRDSRSVWSESPAPVVRYSFSTRTRKYIPVSNRR
jgi:hypothetical protein